MWIRGTVFLSLCLASFALHADLFSELKRFEPYAERRAGIESEMKGLGAEAAAKIAWPIVSGKMEPQTLKYTFDDSATGDYEEIPYTRYKIWRSSIDKLLIKPEFNAKSVEELRTLDLNDVPIELVTAPLSRAQIAEYQKVLTALKKAGAIGTTDQLAVSNQVNTEIGQGIREKMYPETLVAILANYFHPDNRAEIAKRWNAPEVRMPYLGFPAPGFLKRVMDVNYRPTWDQLYMDSMYRAGLEMLQVPGAWTMSDAQARDRLRAIVEERGMECLVPLIKWNFVRYSSLLMYMRPDDWLTKRLIESDWVHDWPILEFREPNNDFNIVDTANDVLNFVAASERVGRFTTASLQKDREAQEAWDKAYAAMEKRNDVAWRFPKPITISESRRRDLMNGADQRARALTALLDEVLQGGTSYTQAGLPVGVIERIKTDVGFDELARYARPGHHGFIYGPDLIEGADGRLKVLEDQSSLVTGLQLVDWVSRKYLQETPELKDVTEKPRKEYFFAKMVENFRARAQGKIVLVRYRAPKWMTEAFSWARDYDDHWSHVAGRFKLQGIDVVEVWPYQGVSRVTSKLESRDDGVYLNGEKVGMIVSGLLNSHLKHAVAPRLLEHFREGRVELSHTPGIELLDSKLLLPYVDRLVEHYLKEGAILHTAVKRTLDRAAIDTIFADGEFAKWVVKSTHPYSAGGRGVFLLKNMDEFERAALATKMRNDPLGYVAQEYTEPALFEGHIFDFRPMVLSSPQGFVDAELPVSRVGSKNGGKTSYSGQRGTRYAPVLVPKCAEFLEGA